MHALGGGGGGAVEVTCTFTDPDVLAPGFGLLTATANVPAAEAAPVAVNLAAETKVVVSVAPPNVTCAPFTNSLPLIVKVKLPTANVCGLTLLSTGAGFQSVRVLVAVAVESAALTALIAAVPGFGMFAGAL